MEIQKQTGGNEADMRKALQPGTELNFKQGQKVIIGELIGRGGSCLVYDATYLDSIGVLHNVRIKECYPYHVAVERREDNSLAALFDEESFKREQERFRLAYERNAEIKQIPGLVNSTGTVSDFLYANGTVYSLLSYEEGLDYREYKDGSLQEVLEHVLAVAKVLRQYHEQGYLHLDIKPENIFVLPETAQHIQLFDFDSVAKIEEVRSAAFRLSCSDGFSAPEQLQGRLASLSPATDIYALGAVVFYKLFGRKPGIRDGELGATYDFSDMLYGEEGYPGSLFKELTRLFRKTIATAMVVRWQRMELVIEQLEKLIPLADANRVYVQDNFTYHSGCFVGRHRNLAELQQNLRQQHMVFLSGIGGIGKTELARRYAYLNRDIYDRILFVPFSESVEETICGRDILIRNEAWEDGGEESLFEARLRIMKEDLTENDLFILDNFDVGEDEQLENLLDCKCKFIITTRNDFRDYNYPQMDLDRMEKDEDLRELFCAYNRLEYTEEEWQSIHRMMQLVDNHTMMVELLAKHLRESLVQPSQLLQQLLEKEGVTSLQEQDVKHRKDKSMREQNINRHLLVLFDLSGFSGVEAELMRSLALLGYVSILRSSFLEYCAVEQREQALEHLVKTGWVKYDKASGKIWLHQIILDLVYNHMNPTAENCPQLVEGMCEYFQKEAENWVEHGNKRKLLGSLLKRLKGNTLSYARLCVLYESEQYMADAERICLESGDIEAKKLLYQMSLWKMERALDLDDMFEIEDETWELYYGRKIGNLIETAEKARTYAEEYSREPGYLAGVLVNLAEKLYCGNGFGLNMAEDHNEEAVKCLYDLVVELYLQAEPLILNSSLDRKEKEELLETIRDFYGEDIITDNYREKHYRSVDKAWYYQQLISSLKDTEEGVIDLTVWSLNDMVDKAFANKEYDIAIKYCGQMLQEGEYSNSYILRKMSEAYQKQRKYTKATECLLRAMEFEKQCGDFDVLACENLVDVLVKRKKVAEARQYANELAEYRLKQYQEDPDDYCTGQALNSLHRLYTLEPEHQAKEELWQQCLKFFDGLSPEEQTSGSRVDFLMDLTEHQQTNCDKVRMAVDFFDRMLENVWYASAEAEKLLNYALSVCETGEVPAEEQIKVLVRLANAMREKYPAKPGKAVAYSRQAEALWKQHCPGNKYLESKVYDSLAESLNARKGGKYDSVEELRSRCDYFLIAQTEETGKLPSQQLELWKRAANAYHLVDNYAMGAECRERVVALLEWPECIGYEGYSEDDRFWEYWSEFTDLLKQYAELKEREKIKDRVVKGYGKLLEFSRYGSEKEDPMDKAEDMEWNIRHIAEVFADAECEAEALVFFAAANYAVLVTEPEWTVLENVTENMGEITDSMLEALQEALKGSVTPRQIDRISDNYGRMKPLFGEKEQFLELKKLLEDFSKQYEQGVVEFKREE